MAGLCTPWEVNGRLKNVCECSISMEKDQSIPIMPFDKPGADPNEEEFEEDNEERSLFNVVPARDDIHVSSKCRV